MLHLNDDCLYEIFRRAPLRDQLTLTTVCMRFHDIVELVWGGKFREFHTGQTPLKTDLTRDEYKALFTIIAAEHLEKLTIGNTTNPKNSSYKGRNHHLPELSFYLSLDYPHVRELHLEEIYLNNNYMRLVAPRFPALQVLHVTSEHFTGAAVFQMQHLRELYMPSCKLNVHHLTQILTGTQSLTHLDVSSKYSPPSYKTLYGTPVCLGLQSLVITESMFNQALERQLWRMSNLRTLRVTHPLHCNFASFFYYFGPSIVEMRFAGARFKSRDFPIKPQDAYRLRRLNTLHLDYYIPNSLLETLKEVTSLRELYFSKTAMSIDLAEFIANSTHLEHIRFKSTPCLLSIYLESYERLFLRWLEQLYKCLKAVKEARPQPLTVYAYGFNLTQELIQRHQNVVKYKAISAAAAAAVALPQEEIRKPYIQFEFSKDGIASHYNNTKVTKRSLRGKQKIYSQKLADRLLKIDLNSK